MQCLAKSQGPNNIRVNAIQPGLLLTEWGLGFGEEVAERVRAQSKLGRLATVEDCAEAFVFLAKADTMTGVAFRVDGGAFEH